MPALSDIFQYLDPRTVGATQGPNAWATQTQGPIIGYHTEQQGGGEGGTVDVQVPDYATNYTVDQSKLPAQYQGLIANYNPGAGGQNGDVQYDYSKLPGGGSTVFGNDKNSTINQMYSLGSGAQPVMSSTPQGGRKYDTLYAKDPSQVKYDPNYGWITPQSNMTHPDEENTGLFGAIDKYGMPASMALAGFFGGPAMALGLTGFNAAKGAISGEPLSKIALGAAPGLIGAGVGGLFGGGGFSLPPELSSALNYGKTAYGAYNAWKQRNPISGAMSLAKLSNFGTGE